MRNALIAVFVLAAMTVGCDDGDTEPDDGANDTAGDSGGSGETTAAQSTGPIDPPVGSTGDMDDSADDGSSTGEDLIPDPGDGMDQWAATGYIALPSRAWPVGLATMAEPYVEASSDATGLAFFVLEAGIEQLTVITTANPEGPIEEIHLHEVNDGVMGDEVPPDETFPAGATWTMEIGRIYLIEFLYPGAGFF